MVQLVTLTYSGHPITCGNAFTLINDVACGDAITDGAAATLTNGGGTAVAITDGATATLTNGGGAITGGVNAPTCEKDLVSLYAVHTNANTKSTTEKVTSPASVGTSRSIREVTKKLANDDLPADKDFDTTYDNENDKHFESEATDTAENSSHKRLRKRQKGFLEIVQGSTEPKFANLTVDQKDFLDRKGRYAPYRLVRTCRIEEEEDVEEYVEGEEEG